MQQKQFSKVVILIYTPSTEVHENISCSTLLTTLGIVSIFNLSLQYLCTYITLSYFFNYVESWTWLSDWTEWNCSGFCHTLTWISYGCTCVPPSWTSSHLPSHPIPLDCPRAPALSVLLHTSKVHWSSLLRMGNIHISTFFFQIIPPLRSTT